MAAPELPPRVPESPPSPERPPSIDSDLDQSAKEETKGASDKKEIQFPDFSLPQPLKNLIGRVTRLAKELYHSIKQKFGFATHTLGTDAKPVAEVQGPKLREGTQWSSSVSPTYNVIEQFHDQNLTEKQTADLQEIIASLIEKYPADPPKRTSEMGKLVDEKFPKDENPDLNHIIKLTLELNWGTRVDVTPIARPPNAVSAATSPPLWERKDDATSQVEGPPRPPSMYVSTPEGEKRSRDRILGKMKPTEKAREFNVMAERLRKETLWISSDLMKFSKDGSITLEEGVRILDAFEKTLAQLDRGLDEDATTKKINAELTAILGNPPADSPKGKALQALIAAMPKYVEQPYNLPPPSTGT